jgi:hypothetical protein
MTIASSTFGERENAFWEVLLNECPISPDHAQAATVTILAALAEIGWVLERTDARDQAYQDGYTDALDAHGIDEDNDFAEE